MKAQYPILLLIIIIVLGEMGKEDDEGRPRPIAKIAPPALKVAPPLPDAGPEGSGPVGPGTIRDEVIVIEDEGKRGRSQYTGTAFSIDDRGLWITARHVTHECDQLVLLRPFRSPLPVTGLAEHNRADVALLQTEGGYEALHVNYQAPQYNQEGFHFGFPRGEPGAVYSRLIGRKTLKSTGKRTYRETIHVWAEKIRVPDTDKNLGGISGGPILNRNGDVVGIHVAGSIRRGRSFSSLPDNISDLVNENDLRLQTDDIYDIDQSSLTPIAFSRVGEDLRKDLTVAQVVCRTN